MPTELVTRFQWYASRLASMGWAEIAYRCKELAKKRRGTNFSHGWLSVPVTGPIVPSYVVSERLSNIPPGLAHAIGTEAEKIRNGQIRLLGASWPQNAKLLLDDAVWHVDPATGEPDENRDRYCFDISYRHGVGVAEIKRIWEINRLQFLVPLAIHVRRQDDPFCRDLVFEIVDSWMRGNPPYRGLNWSSGIELGLRVISVALAFSLIGVNHLRTDQQEMLGRFFAAHELWIARYPSRYSSANNHRMAELAGLIVAYTMAPALRDAKSRRDHAVNDLFNELCLQIHPDGVGAEQAPNYSAFAIELALTALLIAGCPPADIPDAVSSRLGAWAEHVRWLADRENRVPDIGDGDSSRVIALHQEHEQTYVTSIAQAVTGFLNPDVGEASPATHIRDVLFSSPKAPQDAGLGLRTWRDGGYTTIRARQSDPIVLTFDHGPIGYLSIAAHGHADSLAIWLAVGGEQIFVDAGTYLYHSVQDWRDALRASCVHNTLTIRGSSSSEPGGPFMWATKAESRLLSSAEQPHPRVTGEHDGYVGRFGVRHRRTIELISQDSVVVTDELLGSTSQHDVWVSFLLHPSCRARMDESDLMQVNISRPRGIASHVRSLGPLKPRIVRGDAQQRLGWVAPSFGTREPADQIIFEGTLAQRSVIAVGGL
jgi:hypothetical protein